MSAQQKRSEKNTVLERLQNFQVSQGLTWAKVAERLGISLSLLNKARRGERSMSAKALFRLAEVEENVGRTSKAAENLVAGLIEGAGVAREIARPGRTKQETAKIAVDYTGGKLGIRFPSVLEIEVPPEVERLRLVKLFSETLDTKLIALACLPNEFRSETLIDRLSTESRVQLTNAALNLVIPNWRQMVVGGVGKS